MPFEFTAVQDVAASSTPVCVHPATILSSDSVARISRRESFAITPVQHNWLIDCLNTLSISPTHDPFLDHALLIQVIVNGTSTRPAAAKMDSNLKKLKQRVQGFQADCECRTNQIFRLQFLIMAFPDTQWLKSSPIASRRLPASRSQSVSPVTTHSSSTPVTPQGLPLRDALPSRSRRKSPSSNTRAPSSPARGYPSSGSTAPSSPDRPSRPRGGPFSPVRTLPPSVRSRKSHGASPSPGTSPSGVTSADILRPRVQQQPQMTGKSPSKPKTVTVLRSHVQLQPQQPQALSPSVTTPWYLRASVMIPFVTMHVLAGIGVVHLINLVNAFVFSFEN